MRLLSKDRLWRVAFLGVISLGLISCSASITSPETVSDPTEAELLPSELPPVTTTFTPSPEPSPTATHTAEPTPTNTFTPTPTSAPLGGGNGILNFSINIYAGGETHESDGYYIYNLSNSELTQIMSRSQIEANIAGGYVWSGFLGDFGKKYVLVEDGFVLLTEDGNVDRKVDLPELNSVLGFSPDGQYVVLQTKDQIGDYPNEHTYITNIEGSLEPKYVLSHEPQDYFSQENLDESGTFLGWSADSTALYYWNYFGGLFMVDAGMSERRRLDLTPLENQLIEQATLVTANGEEYSGRDLILRLKVSEYQQAVAQDRQQVALTWGPFLFIADSNDLEFSQAEMTVQFGKNPDAFYDRPVWSNDGNYLLIGISTFNPSTTDFDRQAVLVNLEKKAVETVFQLNFYEYFCHFSPDSQYILFVQSGEDTQMKTISLKALDGEESVLLFDIEIEGSAIGCPTWSNPGS